MEKSIRLRLAEWVFNRFLQPFEKVIVAQKVLAKYANVPEVKKQFEHAFGVHPSTRTVKQWQNLVRVYGIETVAKIENTTKENVRIKCMKFSDQVKENMKTKAKGV